MAAADEMVPQTPGPPDLDLLNRLAEGDEAALAVLLAQGRQKLVAYLRFKIPLDLQGRISAEDIVQETHTAVFRCVSTFVPRGANSFERWVQAVAVRQLLAALRRQRAAKRGGGRMTLGDGRSVEDSAVAFLDMLGAPMNTPSGYVRKNEAAGAVRNALEELPEHYRQAIWLVHIEGRSAKEVAGQMGRTHRAVNGLCRRGLKLLRIQLESASRFLG